MEKHEIYFLELSKCQHLLQEGQLQLIDVVNRLMFEADPYPVLFKNLPFQQAINISIKFAQEDFDRWLQWKIAWIDIKETGVLPYDTTSH